MKGVSLHGIMGRAHAPVLSTARRAAPTLTCNQHGDGRGTSSGHARVKGLWTSHILREECFQGSGTGNRLTRSRGRIPLPGPAEIGVV